MSSRWGVSEPSASPTRDGGPRKAPFRPPAHRAVPVFWPRVCCCVPPTTALGIARSSQESNSVLVRFMVLATFLHGLKVAQMSLSLPVSPVSTQVLGEDRASQAWKKPIGNSAALARMTLREGCWGPGPEGHTSGFLPVSPRDPTFPSAGDSRSWGDTGHASDTFKSLCVFTVNHSSIRPCSLPFKSVVYLHLKTWTVFSLWLES